MFRRRPQDEILGEDDPTTISSVNLTGHVERLALLTSPVASAAWMSHNTDAGRSSGSNDDDGNSSSSAATQNSSVIEIMEDEEESRATNGKRFCWSFRVVLLLSGLCGGAIATSWWLVPIDGSTTTLEGKRKGKDRPRRNDLPVYFDCPHHDSQEAINQNDEQFEKYYANASRQITTNETEFLATFRDMHFDDWGFSYEEVKAGMEEFKARYYAPYLHNGSTIYESACGIGLNLYMTLEILRDRANLTNLVVYGNDYVQDSVTKANWLLERVAPAEATKGVVCAGDSSNLSHVPSNAFDLVYTGYLTPLLDPLNLHPDNGYTLYGEICSSLDNETDWMGKKLNEVMQQRQEDWHGNWVREMARIVKPGGPVIIEQIALPYCSDRSDWGGVDQDFWTKHAMANTYQWNVDPKSIEFAVEQVFKTRYNVFMLKNT